MQDSHPRAGAAKAPVDSTAQSEEWLARGRLLLILDVLMTKGSVTKAAAHLGLHNSAVSRLLGQLRDLLGDPIFMRSGRGLVPTPFAEKVRANVRSLAAGIEMLFEQGAYGDAGEGRFDERWNLPSEIPVPPLAFRPLHLLDGQPSPQAIAARHEALATIEFAPARLARMIGIISAGGSGRGRPLTTDEAEDAMHTILQGEADPVQIGALFHLMQGRGATAAELAGFVKAGRAYVERGFGHGGEAALDWPCYTSPNYHNPPWFFHAASLVARAGYKVLLHGATGSGQVAGRYGMVASALGIPVCTDRQDVARALSRQGIAYLPLAAMAPQIYRLMGLHALTESRSPINEVVHLLMPVEAKASLLGVAKPSYKDIHRDAAMVLGRGDLSILGSMRDVAQFTPFRSTTIHRLTGGEASELFVRGVPEPRSETRGRTTSLEYWHGVWTGGVRDARAEKIIVTTAAAALLTLSGQREARFEPFVQEAEALWRARLSSAN